MGHPEAVARLIEALARLPGVGKRTAERYAMTLLNDSGNGRELMAILAAALESVVMCQLCGRLATTTRCTICADNSRDETLLCLVPDSTAMMALEASNEYRGHYFILGPPIDPTAGQGSGGLRIKKLQELLQNERRAVKEILVAYDPTLAGDTTVLLVKREIGEHPRITKLARGLTTGAHLAYADPDTLAESLRNRKIV